MSALLHLVDMIKNIIEWFTITSSLDFDKGGCVIQIKWTKLSKTVTSPCSKL